jgi:hypothetical protein
MNRRTCAWLGLVAIAWAVQARLALAAEPPTGQVGRELEFIEVDPGQSTALRCRGSAAPFIAVGFNYFSPDVGWAPKLWQQFDAKIVRQQLTLGREQGFNTIRVFLTLESFHRQPGQVCDEGVAKFRELLEICRQLDMRVIPCGPDHWEGVPAWRAKKDPFADEEILQADEQWWTSFTQLFADEPTILAWDLLNEPSIGWDSPTMQSKWNAWLRGKYGSHDQIATAHHRDPQQLGPPDQIPIPAPLPNADDPQLFDYQLFRESLADTWTQRLSTAIRRGDPQHLVTVGHIQWAATALLPGVRHYAAFDLRANARHVDFVTIHFYPLASPNPSQGQRGLDINAAYLEAILSECNVGKPIMLGEFAWYGGGEIRRGDQLIMPSQSLDDQVAWGNRLLEVTQGRVCGWLHWAFADTPTSVDLTRWSGIWTADLQLKPWGATYGRFARLATATPAPPRPLPSFESRDSTTRRIAITNPTTEFRAASSQ